MRIADQLQAYSAEELAMTAARRQKFEEEDGGSGRPSSWGPDTVSFSSDAIAARKTAEAAEQRAKEEAGGQQEEKDTRSGAAKAFAEYMDEASGNKGSSPESIKDLQEKLAKLQSKMQTVASSQSIPQETKDAQMGAIQGEINVVMAQIAELMEAETEQA